MLTNEYKETFELIKSEIQLVRIKVAKKIHFKADKSLSYNWKNNSRKTKAF